MFDIVKDFFKKIKNIVRCRDSRSAKAADLLSLHLVTFLMFFILFKSGNRTPGSRFYSDLVDTWADSACIHQLVFKPCSKSTSTMVRSN